MPALRELQQAFGAFMLAEEKDAVREDIVEDGFSAAERFRLYRNTSRSVLIEALRMTYPAVDRLVGGEFFDMAAGRFIAAQPPRSGYLNEYGAGFAEFLAALGPARTVPYLPDVARFEWALSLAANAADAPALDPGALAGIDPELHATLRFAPHPSVRCLAVSYPADQIADAVLSGDDDAISQVDVSSAAVRLVVHRGAGGVESQRLERDAYDFVSRLCAGEPLGALLEAAPPDAASLLAEQLTKGRLAAVRKGSHNE